MTTSDQIEPFGHSFGFTWRKARLVAALGLVLGVVLAFAIPIQVS